MSAKAVTVGPAARKTLLRGVASGDVWRDPNGVTWRRVNRSHKVRVAAAALSAVDHLVRFDGEKYSLTEVGEAELSRLEAS